MSTEGEQLLRQTRSAEVPMKLRNVTPIILLICGCNLLGLDSQRNSTPVAENSSDVAQDFADVNLDANTDLDDRDLKPTDVAVDQPDGIADLTDVKSDVNPDVNPNDMGIISCKETRKLGPVLYWSFDNSEDGTTFANVMNQGSPEVKLSNSVELEAGSFGSGLKFNGQDSTILVAHDELFEVAAGTISLWFLKSGTSVCSDTTTGCGLFSKDAHGFGEGGHFTLAMTGENKIRVRLQSADTTYQVESQPMVEQKIFQHVAVTFGREGLKLFLNGVEEGQSAYVGGLDHGASLPAIHNSESLGLGWSKWNVVPGTSQPRQAFFEGTIDEVAFFNRELRTGEIQMLSNGCND